MRDREANTPSRAACARPPPAWPGARPPRASRAPPPRARAPPPPAGARGQIRLKGESEECRSTHSSQTRIGRLADTARRQSRLQMLPPMSTACREPHQTYHKDGGGLVKRSACRVSAHILVRICARIAANLSPHRILRLSKVTPAVWIATLLGITCRVAVPG